MKLRAWLPGLLLTAFTVVLALLAIAGADALLSFARPEQSLLHRAAAGLRAAQSSPDGPDWPELTDVGEIAPYLEAFKTYGIGIGNAPYRELRTDKASINFTADGCYQQKPNLRKVYAQFRSELFDSLDPMTYFHDAEAELPAEVRGFLDRYTFRKMRLTTNANGERITLPAIESTDKILVAGDSVALGAVVDDDETLPSQLQAADPRHQYVNIGVGGATAGDVVCALQRAAARYPGQIRGIIYPFNENDIGPRKPYGEPRELIDWLVRFKADHGVDSVTIIYMPHIYNTVPELTRIKGSPGFDFARHGAKKRELLAESAKAGFRTFDFTEIVEAEKSAAGAMQAGLALYVDIQHLSPLGNRRLAERLLSAAD